MAVSTDTHSLRELDHLELGIGIARRAWLSPEQVLNTRPLGDLLAWARPGSRPCGLGPLSPTIVTFGPSDRVVTGPRPSKVGLWSPVDNVIGQRLGRALRSGAAGSAWDGPEPGPLERAAAARVARPSSSAAGVGEPGSGRGIRGARNSRGPCGPESGSDRPSSRRRSRADRLGVNAEWARAENLERLLERAHAAGQRDERSGRARPSAPCARACCRPAAARSVRRAPPPRPASCAGSRR